MPFLLTEAALEAHQKELEQEPQPVLLYGASSPRHSPQHHESPPAAKGGFAGFLGSLVSSIGKRGVLGGSKLSAQPSAGCASPLLKVADVSQFSSFSHGSRLDRFLTDAAKSAIVADSDSSGARYCDNLLSKTQSKFDRSSSTLAPQAKTLSSQSTEGNQSKDVSRRRSLPMPNSAPKLFPAVLNPLPMKESGSSGDSRSNSASSLSSDDAIRHHSQDLKSASAQALLSANVHMPTLSEIRSRISMLDDARDKHLTQAQVPVDSTNKQPRPPIPQSVPSVTPVPTSATITGSQPLPPYAMLQAAPQTAISRSKWKQPSEALPATNSTQGGWHYRSVKMSNNSLGSEPQSGVSVTGIHASSTPYWLKVEPSSERTSNVSVPSPFTCTVESTAVTRPSRRHSVDVISVPPPVISTTMAEVDKDITSDKSHFVGSSAAMQRRMRQSNFVQSQRLSPSKMYSKDSVSMTHQNEVSLKAVDSSASVAISSSGIVHGQASNISPGQVFSSLKIGASNLLFEGNDLGTKESGSSPSKAMLSKVTSHSSPGQVFSSLRIGSSEFQGEPAALSSKEIGQQLSQDLSERLERIQRTHTGQHMQQKHQQQPDYANVGSQPQRVLPLAPSLKPAAADSSIDEKASPSFVSDSLEQFVSKLDTLSGSSQTASRAPFSNPDSTSLNPFRYKDKPSVQSHAIVHKELDSLEAFVRDKSTTGLSPTSVPAKSLTPIHSDIQKQPRLHDDLHSSEGFLKQSQQVLCTDPNAYQTSESNVLKASTHSLYRIDSISPSFDEHETSTIQPHHDHNRKADDGDYHFDNSWLFPQGVNSSSDAPVEMSPEFPSGRITAFHEATTDHSTSMHARLRNSECSPDATLWKSPAVPYSVPLSKNDDFDDFVGTFFLHGMSDSSVFNRKSPVSKNRHDDNDFVPSFHVSKNIVADDIVNSLTPSFNISSTFRPVPEKNSSEFEAVKMYPSNPAQGLSHSARYIVRDSQGIELLSAALSKVQVPNCPSLSDQALKKLLTPILRKFDLVAFSNKVKVPTLMAADLVQLAPFNIHFLVDDSVDLLRIGTNWNDAQTLLQECIDFVSLVNTNGSTISFLSSSVSQSCLKAKDQVASLFARVISTSASNRYAAVSKLNIVAALESKVLQHIFAGVSPALVYVLSLQDVKRDHLSVDEMLRVHTALDARISDSNLVPNFVRLSVANVGQGTRNGCSTLLHELRSHATLSSRMTFIEDFECDAAICQEQGVQITPHIYVLKLLLGAVDPNYLD